MGKSDRNVTAEQEFAALEKLLIQTSDDATRCLKLLKKNLSDYDSRHGNHFINTSTSYMRSDMRTAKDTAADLKHVAHRISKSPQPSETEIHSAQKGRSKGVKGAVDNMIGHNDKEYHEREGGVFDKNKEKESKGTGLFGKNDERKHEKHTGLFGKDKDDNKHTGLLGKGDKHKDEKHTDLLGKGDKEKKHGHGLLGGRTDHHHDEHRGGIFSGSDTVEALVKSTLRENFNVSALSHQITISEKSLLSSPSFVERAKEAVHEVKEKIKGDKSSPTSESHHAHKHWTAGERVWSGRGGGGDGGTGGKRASVKDERHDGGDRVWSGSGHDRGGGWPDPSNLANSRANILPESIDQCKGYSAFAVLLDSLNVDQPDGGDGSDLGSGVSARGVRKAAMLVASDESHLKDYLNSNADKMSRSLAVSKVVVNAREIELDSLAKDGAISIYATRQARPRTLWRRPVQQLYVGTIKQLAPSHRRLTSRAMARANGILRACINYVDVKAPFSFTRLHGAGPSMGVELGSTGEMARFGTGMHEAHLTRCRDMVLISIGNQDIKHEFAEKARILQELVSM
ncbi:hypothetical protein PInf_025639 [Phytophthora infestans]|nr:hypothetical protein PInf_025639 [Phytophthora infestans]